MRALRLGPTQEAELAVNRAVLRSPVMPALDRFDGVLYDALDASTLTPEARAAAHGRVLIASALFGLVGAGDPVPAYRLGPDARLPGLALRSAWREPLTAALGALEGPLLDLRSEAYRDLGPIPSGVESAYLRVVAEGRDGRRRALNHVNKHAKGVLVRAVLSADPAPSTLDAVGRVARAAGFGWEPGAPGEIDLVLRDS